jgi:site-specific recombinase XerC
LPIVKQELAAIRHLFDWVVTGHIVDVNPAASVRGPRHVVRSGTTPVLDPAEARRLPASERGLGITAFGPRASRPT